MTLQEALASASDHGRSPLARDIVACKAAWDWLKENTATEKIKRGDFFLVSLEDFPAFCQEALTHSITILPHRDSQRYGNLASELIVAAQSLEGGEVIIPFLVAATSRAYATFASFMAGVMPPMPMLGRSLL